MSNNPPKDADQYIEALEALKARCEACASQTITHDNAGSVRDLVGEIKSLAKSAEKDRKAIKEPYLEQGRKVDAAFKPVAALADTLARPLNKLLTDFLKAEEDRKRKEAEEARRKAEAEARAAEALKEDEFVGDEIAERAKQSEIEAKRAEREADNNRVIGVETDRAMGLRTYRKAKVVNGAMLVGHFANHPDVVALCEKLANAQIRAAKGGEVSIPGIEVIEEKRAA